MKLLFFELKKHVKSVFFLDSFIIMFISAIGLACYEVGLIKINHSSELNGNNSAQYIGNYDKDISHAFESYINMEYDDELRNSINDIYDNLYLYDGSSDMEQLLNKKGDYAGSVLFDRAVFGKVVERCEIYNSFYSDISRKINDAKRILKRAQNPYDRAVAEKYILDYDRKFILKLYCIEPCQKLYDCLTGLDSTMVYMVILEIISLISVCSVIFAREKEKNIFIMIYTTKNGRGGIYWRKTIVVALTAFLWSVVTTFLPMLVIWIYYGGIQGLSEPLQTVTSAASGVPDYRYCPFVLSNMEYLISVWLMRLSMFFVIGLVAENVSILTDKGYKSFLIGIFLIIQDMFNDISFFNLMN